MIRNLSIAATLIPWGRTIELRGGTHTSGRLDEVPQLLKAVELVPVTESDKYINVDPFLTLTMQQGQELMDELWRCGLRPSEGSGSAGSLAATEKHLADMRRIVAKHLDVSL